MSYPSVLTGFALLVLLSVSSALCSAQDDAVKKLENAGSYTAAARVPDVPAQPTASPLQDLQAKADQLTHEFKMQQERNKVYEIMILSLLALCSLFLVLRFLGAKNPSSAPHIVNATGLICIIFGTILLVIMAQSDQQLTAAVGILGAVAGYLFRSLHQGGDKKEPAEN